ncbi:hypothetical protein [Streptomyces werraensis]|uniref:hypothetical protein n=1 Tax=Streptomyces werraensis TaxID=68284 RepID=UPI00369FEFDC
MGLLSEYSINAVPARRFIEVYDADAYLDDAAAMDAARRQVVASNGYHLYLYSLQADIPAQVDIPIWDAPPSAPGDAEGHAAITLDSETGALVVNQLSYGPAGDMTLPRPGVYRGTAWWTGRQAMAVVTKRHCAIWPHLDRKPAWRTTGGPPIPNGMSSIWPG